MITTVRLVNTSIPLHSYSFLCVMRTLKIYYVSIFQVYCTVLLTRVPMLYLTPPGHVYLIIGSLYPLITFHPFLPLPTPCLW